MRVNEYHFFLAPAAAAPPQSIVKNYKLELIRVNSVINFILIVFPAFEHGKFVKESLVEVLLVAS